MPNWQVGGEELWGRDRWIALRVWIQKSVNVCFHFYALYRVFIAEEALSKQRARMACPVCVNPCSQLLQCLPGVVVYRIAMVLWSGRG